VKQQVTRRARSFCLYYCSYQTRSAFVHVLQLALCRFALLLHSLKQRLQGNLVWHGRVSCTFDDQHRPRYLKGMAPAFIALI
jgi:hypothetical protein